ncbi:MAG: thioredoxin [Anaerolineales bacterium]|nr:thioredoxin [Anaerolineales bacterium]MCW5886916.1 thioredoxin [Anaerolineales bacterium]
MSQLKPIDSHSFDADVLQAPKPVLVEFGAVWCQPCRLLEPVLEELAGEWGDTVTVAKLDVDEAAQLTQEYQVLSVPTVMLFKNGKIVERMTGYQPKDKIQSKVEPHIS